MYISKDVCLSVIYSCICFFQYNVTLDDIYSPQWYGGAFISMDPKPGGT